MAAMTTYRNSFHNPDNLHKSLGPATYTTEAKAIPYRGFLIYERIPWNSKTHYGEIDTVINGLCLMNSCTVQGAKYRIDQLLAGNGEDRSVAKMKREGIAMPVHGQVQLEL